MLDIEYSVITSDIIKSFDCTKLGLFTGCTCANLYQFQMPNDLDLHLFLKEDVSNIFITMTMSITLSLLVAIFVTC